MYLDPGFGGMLVQVVIAIVAAVGILGFSLRRKIRNLFSGKKGSDADAGAGESGAAGTADNADDAIDMLSDDDD